MKKRICIIIIILALAVLGFVVYFLQRNHFSLTINGNEISKEEFLDAVSQRKYEVSSYFTGKNSVNVDSEFWERNIDGEIPYEKLADEAVEELKYFHAVYGLAEEKGYVEDGSYEAFLARWKAENQYRKEKIERGEVVYGLSEYTLDLYREYEMDTIQKSYCGDVSNEGMDITDEDREAYYAEHMEAYQQDDDRILDYIRIPYEELALGETEKEELKDHMTAVYKKMDTEHSLAELAGTDELLSPYIEHADVTVDEFRIYSRTISDVLEYAWELKGGESTAVLDENGCLYLIECTERKENGATEISEVKDNINKTLRETRYEEMIKERAENAVVEGDMKRIYSFLKKNLGK